jgi:hypothetical protein
MRGALVALLSLALAPALSAPAQETALFKGFQGIKDVVRGVDFFAAERRLVTPFEKPLSETRQRLETLLGPDLPKGAVFICSSLQQKDNVYEPRVLRMGYGWILIALTADARMQETIERVKSQMGGEVPAEILDRLKNRSPEMKAMQEAGMVRTASQEMGYAVLQSVFAPDRPFRTSRMDDVGRTVLPDWLDIGIATYSAGSGANIGFLQQHLEESFPLEDVLGMSRPFVAPSAGGGSGGGGGGGGMVIRMGAQPADGSGGTRPAGGTPQGGAPAGVNPQGGSGSGRGGGSRVIPKDQQDRMLFDGQSATFFSYLLGKVGAEKVKNLIQSCREGKDGEEIMTGPEMLGAEFDKIEADWVNYVKTLKPEAPPEMRIRMNPDRPRNPPEQSGVSKP